MTSIIDSITNSPLAINALASFAGRLPRRAGYWLADEISAAMASRRNSRLVRAIRANQWVVRGETGSATELDRAVRTALRNSARAIFDLYHYLRDLDRSTERIELEPAFEALLHRPEFAGRGLMIAGIHMAGFDLVLRWFCQHGIRPMVLTMPEVRDGRRTEFEMRRRGGMDLVPATLTGLREAARRLHDGGAVLTGIDRPITAPRSMPKFFGRPAALPMHHIQLAARANAEVVVAASMFGPDGKYHAHAMPALEMSRTDAEGTLRDAERVLQMAESLIRLAPDQWTVPLPVWPSALQLAPR